MSDIERELKDLVRRHRARASSLSDVEAQRDQTIRAAMSEGLPRRRIVELTGLSPQRVDQIRRGARL